MKIGDEDILNESPIEKLLSVFSDAIKTGFSTCYASDAGQHCSTTNEGGFNWKMKSPNPPVLNTLAKLRWAKLDCQTQLNIWVKRWCTGWLRGGKPNQEICWHHQSKGIGGSEGEAIEIEGWPRTLSIRICHILLLSHCSCYSDGCPCVRLWQPGWLNLICGVAQLLNSNLDRCQP